ncbi:MAG: ABC transporter permease [Acidobacteria bacterium]|nr:ABC transporter permease [Acidobacteriota bacterium]
MARHNLGTVVSFEFTRTVKKRRFWIATLAIPVMLAIVFALVFISNQSTSSSADAQKNDKLNFSYVDASGLVNAQIAAAMGGSPASSESAALTAVKDGKLQALFVYPGDPAIGKIKIYAADQGIFKNGTYDAVAKQLLTVSAQQQVGQPKLTAVLNGTVSTESTTYKNGVEAGGWGTVVPPLLVLVIFYLTVALLANQMISSTLEEKENRVTEMILTTLNPTTLVVGKIISLFMVGVVQMVVFAVPTVVGYALFREQLAFPDFDLSHLSPDPLTMLVSALILLGGFILFTGLLVSIGAVMPTVKEAGTMLGPVMILLFVPLYAVSLIISDPSAPIVRIFTFFPLTAPVTALLRNAFGSLDPVSAWVVIAELLILGALALRLAVHLFRYGSIEYSNKLSLKTVFARKENV